MIINLYFHLANYERACEKLQKAETTSDIQTTDTELQKQRK